jgi:SAM-dependent methyltransferase
MNPHADRVRAFYDHFSPIFLTHAGATFQSGLLKSSADAPEDPTASTQACGNAAGLRDGDRVLDAGCGVGGPARALLEGWPRLRLDGVTLSPVQAALATAHLAPFADRAHVQVADYHTLPFPDATFDVVFFFECTAYSPYPERLYREAARVVRSGGRVYVKDVFRAEDAVSAADGARMDAFDTLWACARTGTASEAAEAARAAGLTVRVRDYPHVGVARFVGAMIGAGGELNAFGLEFLRTAAPITFGELIAEKP